jgi:ankyrin repeat protein
MADSGSFPLFDLPAELFRNVMEAFFSDQRLKSALRARLVCSTFTYIQDTELTRTELFDTELKNALVSTGVMIGLKKVPDRILTYMPWVIQQYLVSKAKKDFTSYPVFKTMIEATKQLITQCPTLRGQETQCIAALAHGLVSRTGLLSRHIKFLALSPSANQDEKYWLTRVDNFDLPDSLLVLAVAMNQSDYVHQLIEEEIPVTLTVFGDALSTAINNNRTDIVRLLLQSYELSDIILGRGLRQAASLGRMQVVELYYLELRIQVSMQWRFKALEAASIHGHENVLWFIFAHDPMVAMRDDITAPWLVDKENIVESTLLNSAILHGHTHLVEQLLEVGADPWLANIGRTAFDMIYAVVDRGHYDVANILLRIAGLPHKRMGTILICVAARWGRVDLARLVAEYGAGLNPEVTVRQYDAREIPIYKAITAGHPEMVRFLLLNGARLPSLEARKLWLREGPEDREIKQMVEEWEGPVLEWEI